MKIKKINKDLLNKYYKNEKICYLQDNDITYVTDTYVLFAMKSDDFMLNTNNLKETKAIKEIVEHDYNYVSAELTTELKQIDKKDTCVYIKSKEGDIKCLVNTKYLDYFNDCEFRVLDPHEPVLIYELGKFVGLVMPVNEH